MVIKNYLITIFTMSGLTLLGYALSGQAVEWDWSTFLFIAGLSNTLGFIMLLAYNPKNENVGKPKKVMMGNQLVENLDMEPIDYVSQTGDSYRDNLGYGLHTPNIIGLVYGVIILIIGIIL